MKPCLNQDTLRKTPLDKFLRIAKKTGYDAVEFTVDKIEPIQWKATLSKLRREIVKEGLKVASVNGPENFNLLSQNEFSRLLKRTKKLADSAKELDCALLLPVPAENHSNLDRKFVIEKTTECLGKLADACSNQIRLGLEFLGMRSCSINNLQDALEVVRGVGRSNVGLTLDSFHLYLSGSKFSEIAELKSEEIFMVHVNDCESGLKTQMTDTNRLFPGEGVIDLPAFCSNLAKAEYHGYVSLELLRPAYWERDPEEIASVGRASLKRAFYI